MKIKERTFLIKDIDCEVIVEVMSKQKDILSILEEYIENLDFDWFDGSDDSFDILYRDGTSAHISETFYEGEKIKRNNIVSIIHNNPCTYTVYGPFKINEYGVVTVSDAEIIDTSNLIELK